VPRAGSPAICRSALRGRSKIPAPWKRSGKYFSCQPSEGRAGAVLPGKAPPGAGLAGAARGATLARQSWSRALPRGAGHAKHPAGNQNSTGCWGFEDRPTPSGLLPGLHRIWVQRLYLKKSKTT